MEPKRDEVGVRLDDGLQERVGAYASREGLTVGEAISALLYLGLFILLPVAAILQAGFSDGLTK
jgi:hypothetical protein